MAYEFTLNLPCSKEKLFKIATDFENFNKFVPNARSISIIKKEDGKIFTEEKIVALKHEFLQKSVHEIKENEISTKILEGPMKGTTVNSFFDEIDTGVKVYVNGEIKVGLKYKFFEPIIKRKYKIALTAVLYKMNTAIMEND